MKRILLLILGYFLVLQAALGVLMCCGQPENAAIILIISGLSGWGGYKLIQVGRRRRQELPIDSFLQVKDPLKAGDLTELFHRSLTNRGKAVLTEQAIKDLEEGESGSQSNGEINSKERND